MLSKPAARASAKAARARSALCRRDSRRSSSSRNDWTPKLSRLTPAAPERREPRFGHRFRVGLQRHFGVGGDVERRATRGDDARDLVGLEQRRRAAAEIDRVGGRSSPEGLRYAASTSTAVIVAAAGLPACLRISAESAST